MARRPQGPILWLARGLSLALTGLVAAIAIGHGVDLQQFSGKETVLFACLAALVAGWWIAWWRPAIGALISIAGWATFFVIESSDGTAPGGWIPFFVVPGALFLVGALTRPGAWPAEEEDTDEVGAG